MPIRELEFSIAHSLTAPEVVLDSSHKLRGCFSQTLLCRRAEGEGEGRGERELLREQYIIRGTKSRYKRPTV